LTERKEQPEKPVDEDLFNNLLNPELSAQKQILSQIIYDYMHDKITIEEFKTRFFRQIHGIKLWLKANDKTYSH
jgi:hypothetical protein